MLPNSRDLALCAIVVCSLLLMLWRPRGIREAWWVGGGAVLLVLLGLLPVRAALHAVGEGTDVYLFLTGMMLLSELAREHGVFDWVAARAMRAAKGSSSRLFLLIYAAGVAVTALLSNDATAVVMTPAVLAALRHDVVSEEERISPTPYLFACAMIANAASFILPISNPANLVIYGAGTMPSLGRWMAMYAAPSVVSVAVTFVALRFWFRRELRANARMVAEVAPLRPTGRQVLVAIALISVVLLVTSAKGGELGLPTCITAFLAVLWISWRAGRGEKRTLPRLREVFGGVSWSVLPLVAGLFCLVAAVNQMGLRDAIAHLLRNAENWPLAGSMFGLGMAIGVTNNLVNNLPMGLMMGKALQAAGAHGALERAVLIAVDLGPNLSVTGSLATVLWLMRIRREGVNVSAGRFLLVGMVAMPAALAATLCVAMLVR
jgi:arsenical pump membrane protein